MQTILEPEEFDALHKAFEDIADIKADLELIKTKLLGGTQSEIKWPYGNWENCKYTFPDAQELPALDIRKIEMKSPYIKFNADGSIKFDMPVGINFGTTTNAKNPRMERREYKNMAAKTNYSKGDIVTRDFIVVFHKLNLGTADVVWTQMHGEEDPYYKVVAGKSGIRVQCKTKLGLPGDDAVKTLIPHGELKYETAYRYRSQFDGVTYTASINDNAPISVKFDRPDTYYPKEGAYGPLGVSLTHKPV